MDDNKRKMDRTAVLQVELATMRQQHRDLDMAIDAIHEMANPDMLTLQRLKRQKLAIKDEISRLEDEITPDIIA